jgi:hypothetical protein
MFNLYVTKNDAGYLRLLADIASCSEHKSEKQEDSSTESEAEIKKFLNSSKS